MVALLATGAVPPAVAGLLAAGLAAGPADPDGFPRFYMTVWKAFFLEYVLVPLAFVL